MARKIFVNLPVKDLKKSMEFFGRLGFSFNKQFTTETCASMVISEEIYAMLLTHEMFKQFTPKAITDTAAATEVLICLSCESRAEVDEIMRKGLAAGATRNTQPQDHGFMYGDAFQDLDGHTWEWMWMDPATVQK